MFPASLAHGALLREYWWCDECAGCWLGVADMEIIESTGVVEVAAERGFRPDPS
jgi:hypothetical protein